MDYTQDPSVGAAIFAIIMACFIPIMIANIIAIIGMWKVFEKAGKPGWAAIIPIYNAIVLLEIIGKPIWWLFLFLVPCVNIVFGVWAYNLLSKSFGQSEGFTVGLILLPYVFFPILGFGSYKYVGPAGAQQFSPYGNDPYNNFPNNPPQV